MNSTLQCFNIGSHRVLSFNLLHHLKRRYNYGGTQPISQSIEGKQNKCHSIDPIEGRKITSLLSNQRSFYERPFDNISHVRGPVQFTSEHSFSASLFYSSLPILSHLFIVFIQTKIVSLIHLYSCIITYISFTSTLTRCAIDKVFYISPFSALRFCLHYIPDRMVRSSRPYPGTNVGKNTESLFLFGVHNGYITILHVIFI